MQKSAKKSVRYAVSPHGKSNLPSQKNVQKTLVKLNRLYIKTTQLMKFSKRMKKEELSFWRELNRLNVIIDECALLLLSSEKTNEK